MSTIVTTGTTTVKAVRVVASGTTIIKSVSVGTPTIIGTPSTGRIQNLDDVAIAGLSGGDYMRWDSSLQKFAMFSFDSDVRGLFTNGTGLSYDSVSGTFANTQAGVTGFTFDSDTNILQLTTTTGSDPLIKLGGWVNNAVDSGLSNRGFLLKDNVRGKFGDSADLTIYHDGSNSYISDSGVGSLILSSNNVTLKNSTRTENMATFLSGGAASLYYDDGIKIATTESGVNVSGSIRGDSATIPIITSTDITSTNIVRTGTTVSAGTYGSASLVPVLTVDSSGFIDSAGTVSVAGVSTFTFDSSNATLNIGTADGGSYNARIGLTNFSTTDLSEGTNLYYTRTRRDSDFGNVGVDLVPLADSTYDLGSSSKKWKDLHLSGSTINLGAQSITSNDTTVQFSNNIYVRGSLLHLGGLILKDSSSQLSIKDSAGNYVNVSLSSNTTSDLTEGTNLYYTTARADSDAKNAISGGTGITYNSSTGVIEIGQAVDSADSVTFNNVTVSNHLRGPAEFIIDPAALGDNTGTVKIMGNLQVEGTQTIINSTALSINDKNIVLADSAADSSASNGAGITIGGSGASILYDHANATWDFNRPFGNDINLLSNFSTSNLSEGSNQYFTTARARNSINVVDAGGDGSFTYDSALGKLTYTGPSSTEVRAHLAQGTGMTYDSSSGTYSITNTGVSAGTYGTGSLIPKFTVNAQGQIDSVGEVPVAGVSSIAYDSASHNFTINTADGGSFTQMIHTRMAVADSGTYGSASLVPIIRVDQFGLVDSIGTVSVAGVSSTTFDSASGVFTINTADGGSFPTTLLDSDFTKSRTRDAINVIDAGGDGSLSYDSALGKITYTGPSSAEIRSHFAAQGDLQYDSNTGVFQFDVEQIYTFANFDSDFNQSLDAATLGGFGLTYESTDNTIHVDSAELINYFKTPIRSVLAQGTGVTYDSASGTVSIGQSVGTSDTVEFGGVRSPVEFTATNNAGDTLLAREVVFASGTSGSTIQVSRAVATGLKPAIGIVKADTSNLATASIVTFGKLTGYNTDSFNEGDTLYVSNVAGRLTNVKPTGESSIVQSIGTVLRKHASQGQLFIHSTGVTADSDLPNLNSGNFFLGNGSNKTESAVFQTEVRKQINVVDAGGDGSFAYDSALGKLTYTGPSASDVRAHFSAGEGIDISSGEISGEDASTSNKGIASFNPVTFDVSSGAVSLAATGVDSGTYGSGALIPKFTVNTLGQIDSIGEVPVAGVSSVAFDSASGILTISTADGNSYSATISDSDFTKSRTRDAINVVDAGGDGSLSYDSALGKLTYTGPSASETRAHFTGGFGLSVSDGDFKIDSAELTSYFRTPIRSYFSASNGLTITDGDIRAPQPLDSAAKPTFTDIILSGKLKGPAEFIIDPLPFDSSGGTVRIRGDLQVDGETSTVNTASLNVGSLLVIVADSAADSSEADGGGLRVNGAIADITYQASGDRWVFNKAPYFYSNRVLTDNDAGAGISLANSLVSVDSAGLLTYFNPILVHDDLSGFVANEHIDHSSVSVTTGAGIKGGGDITSTRTISIDSAELLTYYNPILVHDDLSGFVANEHVDHTSVSIATGAGLKGGGTIASTRTLSIDSASLLTYYNGVIVHDNLSGFVANEHIDHSGVTLTAGAGLAGGGDITTNRSFNIDSAQLLTYYNPILVHDNLTGFVANEHIDHSGVTLTAGIGLTGGGDITTNRTFTIDSSQLTSYFGATIMTDLQTRDGAGSGLDADKLDGQQGTHYRIDVFDASGSLLN